jgi:hypothetical protein
VPRIGRVSGAIGQGLGWVLGRSWSQFVGSIGHQLAGDRLGLAGWLGQLLNQCLALALDLDRRGGSNRRPFPYSYPQF